MQPIIIALCCLLVLTAPIASAKDPDAVSAPPPTALPILRSTSHVEVPMDELLIQWINLRSAFLATLDSAGKPSSLLQLEGSTLFIPEISKALHEESFGLRYANRQVIIEVPIQPDPAPLPKPRPEVIALHDVRQPTPADLEKLEALRVRESSGEPCTAAIDEEDLIRRGLRDLGSFTPNREKAYRCFLIALSKVPASLAALDGARISCDDKRETGCRMRYLAQIVAQRPDFYEERVELAREYGGPNNESRTILEFKKILSENPPPPVQLSIFESMVFLARAAGNVQDEVSYGIRRSEIARRYFSLYPRKFDAYYSRYSIVFNDEPVALDLEGMQRWTDAEEIYRRNLSMIAVDPLFEKEVKFDDELGLARTLEGQGKHRDAAAICSHWKRGARLIAGRESAFWGYASRPVETAKWDLSCGKREEGLALLQKESISHPWMYGAFIALRDYYYAHGDAPNALKANAQNSRAHELADHRAGY